MQFPCVQLSVASQYREEEIFKARMISPRPLTLALPWATFFATAGTQAFFQFLANNYLILISNHLH